MQNLIKPHACICESHPVAKNHTKYPLADSEACSVSLNISEKDLVFCDSDVN